MTELPHIRLQNLYKKYASLDGDSHYDVIRFYEHNEEDLAWLPLKQSLNIEHHYLKALFCVERYEKYAFKSQLFLQRLIYHNVSDFDGEKVFEDTIYNRAVSLYYCNRFEESQQVIEELLKMETDHAESKYLYFVLQKQQDIHGFKWLKAGLVVMIFLSVLLLLVHQFIVAIYYPEFSHDFLDGVAFLMLPVLLLFIIAQVYLILKARLRVISFISACKRKKNNMP